MVKGKEIIVKSENGLYVILKPDRVTYGLTNKANATRFDSMGAVRAAIKYALKHLEVGRYTYTML